MVCIFACFSSVCAWQGSTFLIAAYNRVLSSTEITQNYNAGIPNSIPLTLNSQVTAVEDNVHVILLNATDYQNTPQQLTMEIMSVPRMDRSIATAASQRAARSRISPSL